MVFLLPAVAHADVLTLDDALALARAHNRDLRAARARLDASAETVAEARAALLPSVAAQGKYTHNYKEVDLALSAIAPGLPTAVILKQEELDGAVTAAIPLVAPAQLATWSAAKHQRDASAASYDASEASVLVAVAQTYFAAAGADELVVAREHAVAVAKETWQNAKARVEAQVANQVDATRAETAVVRAEQDRAEAENLRASTYRALATLLGTHEAFTVAPPNTPPTRPDTTLRERPEIVAERETIAAASSTASAVGWRWSPTLSAFGNLRAFNYAGFSGDKYAWAVGLELDWVLYDGGARDAQRRQAEAQQREAEARLEQLDDSVRDEIANASGTLDTKQKGVASAHHAFDLATDTLRLVRAQYDAGTVKELDVLEAQDSLVAAEVALAQARFALSLADLELRRATGEFPGKAAR